MTFLWFGEASGVGFQVGACKAGVPTVFNRIGRFLLVARGRKRPVAAVGGGRFRPKTDAHHRVLSARGERSSHLHHPARMDNHFPQLVIRSLEKHTGQILHPPGGFHHPMQTLQTYFEVLGGQ